MKFVHISLALMFWVGAAAAQTAPLPKIEHPNVDLSAGMPGTKMLPGTLDMTQVLKDDAGKPIIDQVLAGADGPDVQQVWQPDARSRHCARIVHCVSR